jgi:hypothetical protein
MMNTHSVFAYKSWSQFQKEAPFLSGPWKMRNLQISTWNVTNDTIPKLQIVFLVDKPTIEYYIWEMPIQACEFSEVRTWLRNYIPVMWKNLLLEEKDGGVENRSGSELGTAGTL